MLKLRGVAAQLRKSLTLVESHAKQFSSLKDDYSHLTSVIDNSNAANFGVKQKRVSSQIKLAMSEELERGPSRDVLIHKCGFTILEVRMSEDLRTAYILWSAKPEQLQDAERYLRASGGRLRSFLFHRLKLAFSPTLKFKSYSGEFAQGQLALDNAFRHIAAEKMEPGLDVHNKFSDDEPSK